MKFLNKPGKRIVKIGELDNKQEPTITIITPFYNGGATLEETANTILSQTYPYFEWIIIDDGSKSESCLKKLDEVSKWDSRIKVFHKENGGPSQARDFGIAKSSPSAKYIYFLDCDDLIENTMLEEMYWALETHKNASWVYAAMINFGANEYYWEPYFTLEEELVLNTMCISSMIKKEDLLEVGCFEIKEKAMYEDWNLWLKLLSKGKTPIRLNSPLFWYRTSLSGELSRARSNHKKAQKLINSTAKLVKNNVEVIQFPQISKVGPTENTHETMILPAYKKSKKDTVLFIADNINLSKNSIATYEMIKRLSKDNNCILILTEPSKNNMRQDIKDYVSEIHDLSNFLDTKDYPLYVSHLITSRNVNSVIINNASYGYAMLPLIKQTNPEIKVIDIIEKNVPSTRTDNIASLINKTFTTNKDLESEDIELINFTKQKLETEKTNIKALKEQYNIPKDKIVISFIDNVVRERNPQLFMNFAKEIEDAIFIINGNGVMVRKLEKQFAKIPNLIYIPEQEEYDVIYKISDIVVNCARKEDVSSTNYKAIENGVPVVSTPLENQDEIVSEKIGKLVTDGDYVTAIKEVLEKLNQYKKNVKDEYTTISNKYDSLIMKVKETIKSKKSLLNEKTFMYEVYTQYENELRNQYNENYLNYYRKYHNITPREDVDTGPISKIKKLRTFAIKNHMETEMAYGLNWLRKVKITVFSFVSFVKNLIISILMIIPLTLNVIRIIFKFIRKLLSIIKQALLSIIRK